MMIRSTLFFLIICLSTSLGFAQADATWQYVHPHDRTQQLLINGQDIWLTTPDGIVRFDQQTNAVTHFDPANGMQEVREIHGMARLNGGIVVVTYDFGLLYHDGDQWHQFDETNSPLPTSSLQAVAEDPNGGVWISPKDSASLWHFDGANWTSLSLPDSSWSITDYGYGMTVDRDGHLWVGTQFRVLRHDGTYWTDLTDSMSQQGCFLFETRFLHQDSQDRIWVGGQTGLYLQADDNWHILSFNLSITDLYEDAQGEVWVLGHQWQGPRIFHLEQDTAGNYLLADVGTTNLPIHDSSITHIRDDGQGGLWSSNLNGELTHHLPGGGMESHALSSVPAGLRFSQDVVETETDLWILDYYTLYQFTFATQHWVSHPLPQVGSYQMTAREDDVWLSARGKSLPLLHFQAGQWTEVSLPSVDESTRFVDIDLGSDQSLWVLSEQYLYHETANGWDMFGWTGDQLPRPPYRALAIDAQGDVWIANEQAKFLTRYDGQAFSSFLNPEPWEYASYPVNLTCDAMGSVWMHYGKEMRRFDGTAFQDASQPHHYMAIEPLDSSLIFLSATEIETRDLAGNFISSIPQYISPLSKALVGTVHQDRFGNQWMIPAYETSGYISVYHPDGVIFATASDSATDTTQTTQLLTPTAFPLEAWQQGESLMLRSGSTPPADSHWELLTVQGQRLQRGVLRAVGETTAISIADLSSGIYYLRVMNRQQHQVVKVRVY